MTKLRRIIRWAGPCAVLFLVVWAGAMPKRW